MKRDTKHIVMLLLCIIVTGSCQSTQAGDNLFTRFKNNIIDTLNYRRLSLAVSTGLGIAAYGTSHPMARSFLGSASLLNVLRTWWQAPNRYTLEGIVEVATRDVVGFSSGAGSYGLSWWGISDYKTFQDVDTVRRSLMLAMDDMVRNQAGALQNDVLALKLTVNKKFERLQNLANGKEKPQDKEEKELLETLRAGNPQQTLALGLKGVLEHYFANPSKIKNDKSFRDIREKFNNLEGIIQIASQMAAPSFNTSRSLRVAAESLPTRSYLYYLDSDKDKAKKILTDSLTSLAMRADDGSLLKTEILAFVVTAQNIPTETLEELVKNPSLIKENKQYTDYLNNLLKIK